MPSNTDWPGWSVDCADPSVGIFADLITHDSCQVDDTDPVEAEQASVVFRPSAVEGVVDVIETFSCPACGASVSSVSQEPAADFEPGPGGDQ